MTAAPEPPVPFQYAPELATSPDLAAHFCTVLFSFDALIALTYTAPTTTPCPDGGMVDALASGASDRKVVEVRVLFWAPLNPKYIRTSNIAHTIPQQARVGRFLSLLHPPGKHIMQRS